MEQKEPSYMAGGNVIWCSYHGEQYRGTLKSTWRGGAGHHSRVMGSG